MTNLNVSPEVWFPAAMVLAGVIVANVTSFVQEELRYRRERRERHKLWIRSTTTELQEVLNALQREFLLIRVQRMRRAESGEDPRRTEEELRSVSDLMLRSRILTSRIADSEVRRLSNSVAARVGGIIAMESSPSVPAAEWQEVVESVSKEVAAFNARIGEILNLE